MFGFFYVRKEPSEMNDAGGAGLAKLDPSLEAV